MNDLDSIPEIFDTLSRCVETIQRRKEFFVSGYFGEPRDDAARWLSATVEERERMRVEFDAKLAAVRAENSRGFMSSATARRAKDAAWQRAFRARNPTLAAATAKRWREKPGSKEIARANLKAHRARVKADPAKYAEYLEKEKERCRNRRRKSS